MAMALLDAGMPPHRFQIDAIDISRHALALARNGSYGRNSFRGQDLAFRDRHFQPAERSYRIRESVSGSIRFVQGNLLDADFMRGAEAYDIVFCRNLLIYFDADTQNRAIGVLKRLLSPLGMLFIGHSEAGLMLGQGLVSAKIPMAFAFRNAPALSKQPKPAEPPARPAFQRPAKIARAPSPRARILPTLPRERPAASPARAPDIDELRRIADRGQLAEAAQGCEAQMRRCGPSPEAFLLLGLISDARGDPAAAAQYYRKVLYLEPDHSEALGHLALLLNKQGDNPGAKILNDRIRRLVERRAG